MLPEHLSHLALVYTTYIIAVASPGPSNLAIMSVAMSKGRKAALVLALGIFSGSMFWALLAATGISALLTRYAYALLAIKIGGGLYLLYLAFKSAKSACTPTPQTPHIPEQGSCALSPLFRKGLFLHLSNPKAVLGWIAVMSLGLTSDAPANTPLWIVSGCGVLGISIFCSYAMIFSVAPVARLYRRSRRWVEGTLAVCFGFAGLRLLVSKT